MCLRPLNIINKGYDPNDKFSSYFVRVPCGKCEECAQQRVADVLFRADYEYQDTIKQGGCGFFITLTFNESNLNWYTFSDGSKCSTWNNVLLQKFTHRLHTYLSRHGFSFKYLITSERGNNGTHRPHYHCIFFIVPLNGNMPNGTYFYSLFARFWSTSKVDTSIPLCGGRWTSVKSPIGLVHVETIQRTQLEAVKYTCKYAFKSYGDVLLQKQETEIVSSSLHVPYVSAVPRSFFSKGIGACFFNNISVEDMPAFFATFYAHQSDGRVTSLPRYYIRKFFYTSSVLIEEDVHDTSKIFNGYDHVNKWPLKNVDGKWIRCRKSKRTTSIRYPIGDKYLELVRLLRFSYFYSWLHNFKSLPYDCNFISSRSSVLGSALSKYYENIPLYDELFHECRAFSFDTLYGLYCDVVHSCNTDNVALRNLELDGIPTLEKVRLLMELFSLSNSLSGTSHFYKNQVQYKNFLPNAVQKRPLLFVPKD